MKYNFGILKNMKIGIRFPLNKTVYNYKGILKKVKQTKDSVVFLFEENQIEISLLEFNKMLINSIDGIVWFLYDKDNHDILSGMVGFTLYDTYGFPIEMSQEILREKNLMVDIVGFQVLKDLQKKQSTGTFKGTDAFSTS